MIFEFHEQKYVEKVYLKLNLEQLTKQESPNKIRQKMNLKLIIHLKFFFKR